MHVDAEASVCDLWSHEVALVFKVVVSFWLYFNLANKLVSVEKHKVINQVSGFTLRLTRAAFLFQGCPVSLRVVEEEKGEEE